MTREKIESKAREISYNIHCTVCGKRYFASCAKRGWGCKWAKQTYDALLEMAGSMQPEIDQLVEK